MALKLDNSNLNFLKVPQPGARIVCPNPEHWAQFINVNLCTQKQILFTDNNLISCRIELSFLSYFVLTR